MRGVACTGDHLIYVDPVCIENEDESAPIAKEVRKRKRLCLADSWFGSMKSAENVVQSGNHCTMIINTAHSQSPKKWLDMTMKEMPDGTWIALKGTT